MNKLIEYYLKNNLFALFDTEFSPLINNEKTIVFTEVSLIIFNRNKEIVDFIHRRLSYDLTMNNKYTPLEAANMIPKTVLMKYPNTFRKKIKYTKLKKNNSEYRMNDAIDEIFNMLLKYDITDIYIKGPIDGNDIKFFPDSKLTFHNIEYVGIKKYDDYTYQEKDHIFKYYWHNFYLKYNYIYYYCNRVDHISLNELIVFGYMLLSMLDNYLMRIKSII